MSTSGNCALRGFIVAFILLLILSPVLTVISASLPPLDDPFTGKPMYLRESWIGGIIIWSAALISGWIYYRHLKRKQRQESTKSAGN